MAGGEERRLTRGVRGGRATSRALKELLAGIGPPAPQPTPASAVSSGSSPARVGPGEPLPARLVMAGRLNRDGSEKDTRHIILADAAGALSYQVGDSLGVVARNCPELVGAIIERLGAKPDTPVLSPDG